MKAMPTFLKSLLIPSLLLIGACSGQKVVIETPKPLPPPPVVKVSLGDVFFDFDKSESRADAVEQLRTNFQWLQENPSQKVAVQGHCDERGTNEYNLALGNKRTAAALSYLKTLGVSDARFSTISYGKEKPLCAEAKEACWSQNRRGEFKLK